MRIRSKLVLILVLPIVAIVTFAGIRLFDTGQQVIAVGEVRAYAQLGADAANLGHALQQERAAAAVLLSPSGRTDERQRAFQAARGATDSALRQYRASRAKVPDVAGPATEVLKLIDSQLSTLGNLRTSIGNDQGSSRTTIYESALQYQLIVDNLNAYRESVALMGVDPAIANAIRAATSVSRAKEYVAQQHVVVLRALAVGRFTPQLHQDYVASLTGERAAMTTFVNAATTEQWNEATRILSGQALQRALKMEVAITRTPPNTRLQLPGGSADWNSAMADRNNLLRKVEESIDKSILTTLDDEYAAQRNQLIIESMAVVTVLLLAIVVALMIAQQMASSLRRLRRGALAVAYQSLPESVARLRNPETATETVAEEMIQRLPDPVQVRTRDEIGQVAQAFNVVHREAVRIAAEQAILRAQVAAMFVSLARRSNTMVERLIGLLDRLERGEQDPDRLAALFQLDHLATRMRRNDKNLLVLANAAPTSTAQGPAPLSDVLRAAQAEVEDYTRIEFGIVDDDIEVVASAVNDVVHLFAELLDNAVSFSPPETAVVVDARWVGDRAIVAIEDRGPGLTPEQFEELNARLAAPATGDVAVTGMMGLHVVSRLATRHQITVELRASSEGGTIAEVVLPVEVLEVRRGVGGRARAFGPLAIGSGEEGRKDDPPRSVPPRPRAPESPTPPPRAFDAAGPSPATESRSDRLASGGSRIADAFSAVPRSPYRGTAPTASTPPPTPPPPPSPSSDTGSGLPRRQVNPTPSREQADPTPSPAPAASAASHGHQPDPAADATAELPVFGGTESVWFRVHNSRTEAPPTVGDTPPASGQQPAATPSPSPATDWRTPADAGWHAASEAATPIAGGTTAGGLPKRIPMSQLVPGGIEPRDTGRGPAVPQRSPEAVRGLLSAYHRGVRRARGQGGGRSAPPTGGGVR